MPSMLEALRDMKMNSSPVAPSDTHISASKMKGAFAAKVDAWKKKIVGDYYNYGIDLNKSISKIAETENLSTEQISRIIEEVNCEIYLVEYKKLERSPVRDVDFEIASLTKIKDLMDNGAVANQETVSEPGEEGVEPKMKKRASWGDDNGDSLDFMNCSVYDTPSLVTDKRIDEATILRRKIAEKVASANEDAEQAKLKYASDVLCFAEALIGYEKLGCDAQSIFEKVCQDADLRKVYQIPVTKAVMQKVASMQEAKLLPGNFELNLSLADIINKQAGLSLGKHSLIKAANESMNNSNKALPSIKTEKQLVKGYQDLVRLALKVQEGQDHLQKKVEQAQSYTAKLS